MYFVYFTLLLQLLTTHQVFADGDSNLQNSYSDESKSMEARVNAYSEQAMNNQLLDSVKTAEDILAKLNEDKLEINCNHETEIKNSEERKFVIVGVSGFMTKENGGGQPSGVHDNLPSNLAQISATYKITHNTKDENLDDIIKSLNCDSQTQPQRPGLIVMINSWGAETGFKLAKKYYDACNEPVEAFIFVDGIGKPMNAYNKIPIAKKCLNYFQTRSLVHGRSLDKCENIDLSNLCSKGGIATCHIEVEWIGSSDGALQIKYLINNN